LGYDRNIVEALPDAAIESFAGVANPLSLRDLAPGERVVDLGSGAGFDWFIAAGKVGASGRVVGVDMTETMLEKSRRTAQSGCGRHRSLDGLNCRWSALCSLAKDDRGRGFVDVAIGPPVDTFAGAGGERNARWFEVFGYAFIARKPG